MTDNTTNEGTQEWAQEFLKGVDPADFITAEELPPEVWDSSETYTIVDPAHAKSGLYAVDRPSKSLTRELTESERKNGINTAGKGEMPTRVLYSIDMKDVPVFKRLSYYETLCIFGCAALYNAGNEYVSLDSIYEAMGGVSDLNKTMRENLLNTLLKLNKITICIDNSDEVENGQAYNEYKYYGSILPLSLESLKIRGREIKNGIHLLREPPVIEFARMRKQVAPVNIKALQNGLELKESNLQLRDYCLRHVLSYKSFLNKTNGNKKAATTILIDSLCRENSILTKMQRQRLPARLAKIFDSFVAGSLIDSYQLHYDKNKKLTKITFEPLKAGGTNS